MQATNLSEEFKWKNIMIGIGRLSLLQLIILEALRMSSLSILSTIVLNGQWNKELTTLNVKSS
jgi:hypothetical protein